MPPARDPFTSFSRLFTAPPTSPGEFVDRWVDATTWWVEPLSRTSSSMRERMAPERLLAELIDGVLGRFGGQRLELVLRGQAVKGVLESLRVSGRDRTLGVVADLTDVDWAGPPLSRLQARARGVRVASGSGVKLKADGVDVEGRCELVDVVRWVDGRTGPWDIGIDDRGHLRADRVDGNVGLTAEPVYVDGRLELELRAAHWRGHDVRIPRWLRLTRTQDLPELPDGMALTDVHRSGGDVSFRLDVGEVDSPLDLAKVRDAVLRGSALPVG